MRRLAIPATTIVTALCLTACSGSPPPAPKAATAAPVPAAASAPAATPAAPGAKAPAPTSPGPVAALTTPPPLTTSPPDYASKGRRDPFTSLEGERAVGGLTVATAKLTGILRGGVSPLALVETPDGLGYILKPGDTLGDGRLVDIGRDTVVFTVVPKPGMTNDRVVLKLPGD
jgi:hypothetical protein